ncbi:MAG: HAMP domain-containing protein [Rhizobiales bacterium]|nr:HAMP domain-containing protein [Hyphomicrobiales bacterium]
MFNVLNNLKIGKRIFILVLAPAIGLAILALTFFSGDRSVELAFQDNQKSARLADMIGELRVKAAELARREKDFLLRNDDRSVSQSKAAAELIEVMLVVLGDSTVNGDLAEPTARLKALMASYESQFSKVVLLQRNQSNGGRKGTLARLELDLDAAVASLNLDNVTGKIMAARSRVKDFRQREFQQGETESPAEQKALESRFSGLLDDMEKEIMAAVTSHALPLEEIERIKKLVGAYRNANVVWATGDRVFKVNVRLLSDIASQMDPYFIKIETVADNGQAMSAKTLMEARETTRMVWFSGVASLMGIILFFGFLVGRSIIRPIKAITGVFEKVATGQLNVAIPSQDRKDEIGQLARILASFHENTTQAVRTQSALDVASAPFMLVEPQGTIVAINKAAEEMFRTAEADLQAVIPEFRAGALVGSWIMAFGGVLADDKPETTKHERMVIGGRTFDIVMTPVLNSLGERLGTSIEWKDMTDQLATEQQVATIVHAARDGDFTKRILVSDKSGFMLDLSRGMNDITETVDRGLSETVRMMSALARGDLTQRVVGEFKGSFLQLKTDANTMADKIRAIARRISGVSGEVQGATREIASGVADLSARTEHQASSLEETSASMEQLATTVRQNAGNAQEANRLAAAASTSATSGGDIANRAVTAMGRIEDSSRQITEIVGLIQDIAFQTNLLALNAAVEAARAGEAGKGFAVVANEVRALAQRASQASKDIKGLIVNSDTQVREGVTLVKQAGSSLTEIVASVKKVATLVSEIAAATQEQSSGIEQVSKAVTGMDQMTQQNAALVEETNAALQSAQAQVDELRNVVDFFKTDDRAAEERDRSEALPEPVNPVRQQFQALARKVAGGRAAAVAPVYDDWKEF